MKTKKGTKEKTKINEEIINGVGGNFSRGKEKRNFSE